MNIIREVVILRRVSTSTVITLPKRILNDTNFTERDSITIEVLDRDRLIIKRED